MLESQNATILDPSELEGLKYKHITTREELNRLEQANIQMGIQWLSKLKNPNILDEMLMRAFHKKLFGNVWKWAGHYRKTEKNIGINPKDIQIELRKLIGDVMH